MNRLVSFSLNFILGFACLLVQPFESKAQKFEHLALTPPMGWNSWNKFACDVSEQLIMGMADAMVSSGMKAAGYEYIVIDDCWQVGRDDQGEIIVDAERFPNGMKHLVDYIHSKGLKFGIYSCAGSETCAGRPGSLGHEYQDARTYARWGVDYLKYDWCHTTTQDTRSSYANMRDALYAAGRPIVFSICEWGGTKPWEWGKKVGHLWRTTHDIRDNWDSMIGIVDEQKELAQHHGPDGWNDPDMLEVGNGGMTVAEYRTHFSLWCMLSAPLMAGNDLANMAPEIRDILTNHEMIAIDQDSLGKQAVCYRDNGDYEIWGKALVNKEKVVCLVNRSDEEKEVEVNFHYLIKKSDNYWYTYPYKLADYSIRDLWAHKEVKIGKSGIITVKMAPHTAEVYRFVKKQ